MNKLKTNWSNLYPYLGLLFAIICLSIALPFTLHTLTYSCADETVDPLNPSETVILNPISVQSLEDEQTPNIGIIVGHGTDITGFYDSGALAKDNTHEFMLNQELAYLLELKLLALGMEVSVYNENVYRNLKYHDVTYDFTHHDFIIEIHFNSSEHAQATGTQIIANSYNQTDLSVHRSVAYELEALTGTSIILIDDDFIIQKEIAHQAVYSMLLESVFIDNLSDYTLYTHKKEAIADAIARGLNNASNFRK